MTHRRTKTHSETEIEERWYNRSGVAIHTLTIVALRRNFQAHYHSLRVLERQWQ